MRDEVWLPEGKVAVVTGAASGIGAAITTLLRERGATVVATDLDGGDEQLDVRDAARFDAVIASAIGTHGRIDLLVNNAGIAIGGDVERMTIDHWDRIIDINVRGVVNGMRAAYPSMVQRGSGRIVNIASVAGLLPSPLLSAYSMTKHAVVGLSLSWREEARPHGVGVHVVCPGVIETPLLDTRGPEDLDDAFGGMDARRYLTSILGKPYPVDDLAEDVLAGLARDRAVIVAPRVARLAWRLYRATPALFGPATRRAISRERAAARASR